MSNSKGYPSNLKPYRSQWQSGPTQTIRVPIALADQLLEIAHQIDRRDLPAKAESLETAITQILADPLITRNGKDRGSIKRALSALKIRLQGANHNDH